MLANFKLKIYVPDNRVPSKKCPRKYLRQFIVSKKFDYYEQVVNNALIKRMAVVVKLGRPIINLQVCSEMATLLKTKIYSKWFGKKITTIHWEETGKENKNIERHNQEQKTRKKLQVIPIIGTQT